MEKFQSPEEINKSWSDTFTFKQENKEENQIGLRHPQLGAIYRSLSHWSYSEETATIVMPTGTGKTETMLSLLVLNRCRKLLVIVPTNALREQISDKFITFGILKKLEALRENALHPVVGILKTRFKNANEASEFFEKCNVVVATANILAGFSDDIFAVFTDRLSHIFIDEAHHAEAASWFKIRDKFKGKRILQFTATPYRNDGKRSKAEIIYSYPLKKAQKEGYFKQIKLIPISEYNEKIADKAIAEKAIEILREDRKKYPHILLARVSSKKRADEVFAIYQECKDFNVAKIYSGIANQDGIKQSIINKEIQIIVCVDMLGEGFDLPELKIAAFHDVKKSLPTTIQFIGRFTRDKFDEELGTAKVIINRAGLNVEDELDELYAQDNDWNDLLPIISETKTQKEVDFQETIAGFNDIEDFIVSLHTLKPAMSTVIYKNHSQAWNPQNFKKGLTNKESYEVIKSLINDEKNVLVAITAQKLRQKWTDNLDIFDLSWNFYLIYWDEDSKLLFIHSSDNSSLHENLAKSIIGDTAEILDGEDGGQIFRCLGGLDRFKLQNVGLVQLLGKLIRFQMSVGTDIEPALSRAEINRAKKSHIFGVGYENGNEVTIGCSYKGRIWSQVRDDIDVFIKWCRKIGTKVLDETIDPEQVLRGAIVPKSVSERPSVFPVCIDWSHGMYQETETRYKFKVGEQLYDFYNSELCLINPSETGNIQFGIASNNETVAKFRLEIYKTFEGYNDFRIVKTYPSESVSIEYGKTSFEIEKFFYKNTPEIWFADGSVLEGDSLSEIKEDLEPYQKDKINTWDWHGVDLSKESQGITPKIKDSIQYRAVEILKKGDYDIIYDDDYSGEMADIVTVKKTEGKMLIEFYHLKFAKKGVVSREIENLYAVCGQAQKSVHWKFKKGSEFFDHLLRRMTKSYKGQSCSRLEKGTPAELLTLLTLAKHKLAFEFKIYVVQPGTSKSRITQDQLTLLAVTENYLKAKAIELNVITSD